MRGWSRSGLMAALLLGGCSAFEENEQGQSDRENEVVEMQEYVSKTPAAKVYMQQARDPNIVLKPIGEKGGAVQIDTKTGDKLLMQTADRERRINYYAYTTKNDELVRVFMTQFGAGSYGNRWKVFPIRVWNIEEAKRVTPAVEAAQKRATLERFAEFISSEPDWIGRENAFMVIDAPVSEVDPL